jgi:hypothetical protein
VLLFKILLAPLLIALVSLAGRKWGPGVSGWLLGIPLSSGPILFFLALEQGRQFAARSAVGSLLGILGWAAFTVVYAYACLKWRWWSSTLAGWIAYFVVAGLLLPVRLKVVPAFLLVSAVLAVILWIFPRVAVPRSPAAYGRFDLWLRMAAASLMVVMLTGFARLLGPATIGILSAFPAYTTILAVFSHRHEAAAAVHVLNGVAIGLYTAATFFLVLSPSVSHFAIATAFTVAVAGALVVQAGSLVLLRRYR